MPSITHKELTKCHLGLNAQGDIIFSEDGFKSWRVVAKACAVDEKFRRLFAASQLTYTVLCEGETLLEEAVKLLEDNGQDNLAMQLVNLGASIKAARNRILSLDELGKSD